ncbi:MAG: putative bifunctional diguanylate cyclase/phosphodiesterase [Gammaproteobacteria bacterium]
MTTRSAAMVLVVDDDEMLRVLTRAALESAGFRVSDAADGAELVEAFHATQPDIVLLDVMMPRLDGFDACALLRREAAAEHVPVLMMTGLDDVESINRAYEAGATDFVTKPINFDLLSHRLRYMLRAKHTADALRESEARLSLAQRIARLGYWESDGQGRFTSLSAEIHGVLGVPETVELGSFAALSRHVHAEDRAQLDQALLEAVRRDESFVADFRVGGDADDARAIHLVAIADRQPDGTRRYLGTLQDISERRRAEQQIHRLSFFDNVTGLPNRVAMRGQLAQALGPAARHNRVLAVMSIDLDNFQRINDSLGFATGDELLRAVGGRFRHALRISDAMARLPEQAPGDALGRAAGDEFIVLLPEIGTAEDAAVVAQRLRNALARPFDIGGKEIHVRASIGIAVYPDDGNTADDLLGHADAALAQAKHEGRDCYQFFTGELNARAFKRLTMEMQLRGALKRDEFSVYFQPKLDARTLAVAGFEALIRWQHPELGRVSPAEFIPIAEETGLIVPIGEWVLDEAARQLAAWDAAGLGGLRCAVNLSGGQFRIRNLAERVTRIVERAGLSASRIELELTESILMEDAQLAVRTLNDLKAAGFGLAVDDFGTGYSSLSYLKRLPIDVLKIDQSFVRDLPGDADDIAIVNTIVSMARGLGLKTVAEGVETAAQRDFLREQGCDELQGYLFSPPKPAEEVETWLRDWRGAAN